MTEQHDAPEGAPLADAELKPFGWAPGSYSARCVDCECEHDDTDKRSTRCRPCAVTARRLAPTPPASLGLAGRTLVAQMEQTFGSGSVAAWDGSDEKAIVGADATLWGQQGWAVPAGVESSTEASIRTTLEAHRTNYDEWLADRARLAEQSAPAGTGTAGVEGLRIKPLDWQETFTDRGDGTQEVTGWEAATGFGEWYSVESFMSSDSYGYQALLGHEVIKSTDDPEAAKEYAQADYERRVRAALDGASG